MLFFLSSLVVGVAGGARRGTSSVLQRTVPYDREAFVFDPRGRVLQLEYAEAATELGGPVVALVVGDSCVVCAWTRGPRRPLGKVGAVDDGTFVAFAGLRADGLALADAARVRSARSRLECPEERPSPRSLARAVGDLAHEAARGGGSRCYGARLVVAGLGADGDPELWTVGPSGVVERRDPVLRLAGAPMVTLPKPNGGGLRDAIDAVANAAFAADDDVEAIHVLAFRRDPLLVRGDPPGGGDNNMRSPRVLAWEADLRRADDFVPVKEEGPSRLTLHPEAAASLVDALAASSSSSSSS